MRPASRRVLAYGVTAILVAAGLIALQLTVLPVQPGLR
jgi:hypothetical protein